MTTLDENPGQFTAGQVAFANDERSWTESFDVVDACMAALNRCEHQAVRRGNEILLPEVDLSLQALLVGGARPREEGGVSTTTTVEIRHNRLFRSGVFEYQRATGDNVQASLERGFDDWVQLDLVPILDALRESAKDCACMTCSFPATAAGPELMRRIVLGPVRYCVEGAGSKGAEEHEPFCPCCFFTHSYEAFQDLLRSTESFAIRFFAMRGLDECPSADCRVNGIDHERGAQALRDYAKGWSPRGVEFRKQYVVIHSV